MAGIPQTRKPSKKNCAASLAGRGGWQRRRCGPRIPPLTDLRASASYRSRVAGDLIIKALAEIAGVGPQFLRRGSPDTRPCRRIATCSSAAAPMFTSRCRDGGAKHVQGSAECDDIPEPIGTLHIAVGGTPVADARSRSSEVRNAPAWCGSDGGRHSRKERRFAGERRQPVRCRTPSCSSPAGLAVATSACDAPRRAAVPKIEVDAEAPNVRSRRAGRQAKP
jgi:hypothetical protein